MPMIINDNNKDNNNNKYSNSSNSCYYPLRCKDLINIEANGG